MPESEIDCSEISGGGELNEALKDCRSDRDRFQATFWLLNQLKYMDAPSTSGWRRTAERLRTMGDAGVEEEAAKMFASTFNKSALRGWQDLLCASIAVYTSLKWNEEYNSKCIDRLIDNATADKNKAALEKWEYTRDQLMGDAKVLKLFEKMFEKLEQAVNESKSPALAMRFIEMLPYGPNAETKEDKKKREAQQKMADEEEDDF
jgi:hypothetical protein